MPNLSAPSPANPEISERPRRRTFTAPEKLRILKEADQAAGSGDIGAILRRHGLYSSALCEWRRQREAGTLGGLTPVKRGPKPVETNPLSAKLTAAQRENAQLRRRLNRAEAIIELQKKLMWTAPPSQTSFLSFFAASPMQGGGPGRALAFGHLWLVAP